MADRDLLRILSTIPFRSPSFEDRSVNPTAVARYFNLLEEWRVTNNDFTVDEKKDIIKIITTAVNEVQYVSYYIFWPMVLQAFDEFSQFVDREPFWVVVDGRKIGSEIWILQGLADKILSLPGYKGVIKSDDTVPDELVAPAFVVSFDDCIYSGTHLYQNIFGELAAANEVSGLDAIAVVPFFSEDGVSSIADAAKDQGYDHFYHFGSEQIEPIMVSGSISPEDDKPYLYDMEFESPLLYPVYFDHKVAGTSSSFPTIYLEGRIPLGGSRQRQYIETGPLLRSLPDRSPITELAVELEIAGWW